MKKVLKKTQHNLKNVFGNVLKENPRQLAPDYRSVRSSLYRIRAKKVPTVPHEVFFTFKKFFFRYFSLFFFFRFFKISDIRIDGRWAKTLDGKRFLLKHDASIGVTIFATREALNLLGRCTSVLGDGTFKATPEPYDQLYIIFGDVDEYKLPLVYSYMNGKSAPSIDFYCKLWRETAIFERKNLLLIMKEE